MSWLRHFLRLSQRGICTQRGAQMDNAAEFNELEVVVEAPDAMYSGGDLGRAELHGVVEGKKNVS